MSRRFEGPPPSVLRDEKKLCIPTCGLFRCSKGALVIKTEYYRGKPVRVAYCRWIGDKCIGWKCQFAYCERRALLPNGKCGLAIRMAEGKVKGKDMLEEIRELEIESKKFKGVLRSKIKKRGELEEF